MNLIITILFIIVGLALWVLPLSVRITLIVIGVVVFIYNIYKNKMREQEAETRRTELYHKRNMLDAVKAEVIKEYRYNNISESDIQMISQEVYETINTNIASVIVPSYHDGMLELWNKIAQETVKENINKYSSDQDELEELFEDF